jgi:PrtD family type I secretion system ABC transporter
MSAGDIFIEMGAKFTIKRFIRKAKVSVFHIFAFSIIFNILLFVSPLYMIQIYNRVLPNRSDETLLWLSVLVVILFVSMGAIDVARNLVLVRLSRDLDSEVTRDTIYLSLFKVNERLLPSNVNVLRDIDQVRGLFAKGHIVSVLDILWFPVFLFALFFVHPYLAVLCLVSGVLLAGLAFLSHIVTAPAIEEARSEAVVSQGLADQLRSKIDVIRANGMMSALVDQWVQHRDHAVTHHVGVSERLAAIAAVSRSSRMLAQSLALGVGAYLAIHGSISAGAIIAGSILVGRAIAPIDMSIAAWHDLRRGWSAYARIKGFLSNAKEPTPQTMKTSCEGRLLANHLSYSIGNHVILRDINFEIQPGEMLAIVGPSGSGKTTLIRHLIGGVSPQIGTIRLENIEVANLTDDSHRQHLGYVPQDIQLLNGSIIESISRFGQPDAEDVVATAKLAGVHDMIMRLPENYGARIGRDGFCLSAGQRQQLALARALYGEPVLVVLDEPCSHLDETGELSLVRTLRELRDRGVTVCMATHKANLIRLADSVLILGPEGQARLGKPSDLFRRELRTVNSGDFRDAS